MSYHCFSHICLYAIHNTAIARGNHMWSSVLPLNYPPPGVSLSILLGQSQAHFAFRVLSRQRLSQLSGTPNITQPVPYFTVQHLQLALQQHLCEQWCLFHVATCCMPLKHAYIGTPKTKPLHSTLYRQLRLTRGPLFHSWNSGLLKGTGSEEGEYGHVTREEGHTLWKGT